MASIRDSFPALVRGERKGLAPALLRRALWGLQWPYALGTVIRNRRYDRGWATIHRVPCPIVSVGNLSLGGTGKTPCVEAIARWYRDQGLTVAILSRGYGSESGRNDEAMLLEENLPDVPHLQGADRATLALTAVEELESELLILDDGFQHRRLHRDLDIVLIDATRPLDRESIFPRGMLREPLSNLARADVLVLTRCDQADPASVDRQEAWLRERFPRSTQARAIHAPQDLISTDDRTESIESLQGRSVVAFCGLGNPEAFQTTLTSLGAKVQQLRTFPDHHPYARADVESLQSWVQSFPADVWVITSQKDFVKLRIAELSGRPLWALRIGMEFIQGAEALHERLAAVVTPG